MTLPVAYTLIVLASLAGLVLSLAGLPGVWLILAAALGFDALVGWHHIHWGVLIVLGILAILGSVLDDVVAGIGARRFGGSHMTGYTAILGSLLGAILLTPLIPVPIVGTLLGALIGAFAAAYLTEYSHHQDHKRALRAALGAFVGRLGGILIKFTCALAMISLIAWQLIAHR